MAAPLSPSLVDHLRSFFARAVPEAAAGAPPALVVAFSGGPDSTALLAALVRWNGARHREGLLPFPLVAAHLDHGMDPGSAERAEAAREIVREIESRLPAAGEGRPGEAIAWREDRRPVPERARPGESLEEAARRVRYAFLEEVRRAAEDDLGRGAWVLTAHHRDDQAETVALRLLAGSGLRGLAGIAPRRDGARLLRPLLTAPKRELLRFVASLSLDAVDDPTNRSRQALRNRVRRELLPALARQEARQGARREARQGARREAGPGETPEKARERIAEGLAAVAAAARGARGRLDARLARHLDFAPFPGPLADLTARPEDLAALAGTPPPLTLDRAAFAALPEELRAFALGAAHARAGGPGAAAPYPASAAARRELAAQLARGAGPDSEGSAAVGCDAGNGWRWEGWGSRLVLRRAEALNAHFFYTVEVPGEGTVLELAVPELAVRIGIRPAPSGSPDAVFLPPDRVPPNGTARLAIRDRRPGDRFHARGRSGPSRLKEAMDRARIPGWLRGRLPLLTVDGEIAWVAGLGPAEPPPAAGRPAWRIEIHRDGGEEPGTSELP